MPARRFSFVEDGQSANSPMHAGSPSPPIHTECAEEGKKGKKSEVKKCVEAASSRLARRRNVLTYRTHVSPRGGRGLSSPWRLLALWEWPGLESRHSPGQEEGGTQLVTLHETCEASNRGSLSGLWRTERNSETAGLEGESWLLPRPEPDVMGTREVGSAPLFLQPLLSCPIGLRQLQ